MRPSLYFIVTLCILVIAFFVVGALLYRVIVIDMARFEKSLSTIMNVQRAYEMQYAELLFKHSQLYAQLQSQADTLQARERDLAVTKARTVEQERAIKLQQSSLDGLKGQLGGVQLQLDDFKKLGGEPLPKDFINSLLQASARVRCLLSRTATTENFRAGSGSILGRYSGAQGAFVLMTNAHVITERSTGGYDCEIVIGEHSYIAATVLRRVLDHDLDFAFLKLGDQKSGPVVVPVAYEDLGIGFCEFRDVVIGDRVTIISFPQFQGPAHAVSEGYITEFLAGPIYTTTAVIDQGSSGGVAILNKKHCALGMPTWEGIGKNVGSSYIQSWPMMLSYK